MFYARLIMEDLDFLGCRELSPAMMRGEELNIGESGESKVPISLGS